MGNVLGHDTKVAIFSKDPVDEDQTSGKGPIGKGCSKDTCYMKNEGFPQLYVCVQTGDPDDFTLREKEILVNIPSFQYHALLKLHCKPEQEEKMICIDEAIVPSFGCLNEFENLMECINYWNKNEELRDQMTKEYLLVRQEYRKTGRRRLYRALKGDTYVEPHQLKGFQV